MPEIQSASQSCQLHNDRCCCKCSHQVPINCHPWNEKIGKGRISERLGWGCLGFRESENYNVAIFSESEHGSCELFKAKLTLTSQ